MTRYRRVEQYAGMFVIKLLPIDMKDLNLKIGDIVDIEDAVNKSSISSDLSKKLKVKTK